MAFTLEIGDPAPEFSMLGTDDRTYSLADFEDAKVLVLVFTCNHCPAAQGMEDRLKVFHENFTPQGVTLVAINSNEDVNHPTDSFEHMKLRKEEQGLPWTYLRDEDQSVAFAYGALRTPHFYVFDSMRMLRYTGRFDENPFDDEQATTHELVDAVKALLDGGGPKVPVTNPIGCNVKWRDQDAHWMPAEACDLV
ncbi:MAG: thioredoxin family protein [Verrucomicrobia bacterium]|nr:thioredoxin family protein [Verrucomicrobiota bacterium]MDA1088170.1 thioredoxin family protein [Verrucomicrobiota bacterium]